METFTTSSLKSMLQMKQNEILQFDGNQNYDDLNYSLVDDWHDDDRILDLIDDPMIDVQLFADHEIEKKFMGGAYYDDTGNDFFYDEDDTEALINSIHEDIDSCEQLRYDDWYDDFVDEEGSPNVITDLNKNALQALIKMLEKQELINLKLRSICQYTRSTETQKEDPQALSNSSLKTEATQEHIEDKDILQREQFKVFSDTMKVAIQYIKHTNIALLNLKDHHALCASCQFCDFYADMEQNVKKFTKEIEATLIGNNRMNDIHRQ